MQYTFTQRTTIFDKPADLPADCLVFNAPRPLVGSWQNDIQLSWKGDFLTGVFYAAIMRDDQDRQIALRLNHQSAAVLVRYVSENEAKQFVAERTTAFLAAHPKACLPDGYTIESYVEATWKDQYFTHHAVKTVTVDSETLVVE